MTNVERMHEERLNSLDRRVDVLSQKIDDYIAESRAARAKTDEELKEMRAEMKTLNQRMDSTLKNIQNLTVAAMVGIGAAILGIGGISIAVISFVISK